MNKLQVTSLLASNNELIFTVFVSVPSVETIGSSDFGVVFRNRKCKIEVKFQIKIVRLVGIHQFVEVC